MRRYYRHLFAIVVLIIISAVISHYVLSTNKILIDSFVSVNRAVKIRPDYTSMVIPPNIAPLNFVVKESGTKYYVNIHSEKGDPIEIFNKNPKIIIPQKQWHKLISLNRGNKLIIDVCVKGQDGKWKRYNPIINNISLEQIDPYIVYRKVIPTYWHSLATIAIYSRSLSNYEERLVLDNSSFSIDCLNCHAFCKNDPDKMLLGIRSYEEHGPSTVLLEDDKLTKIDTKIGYTSWHPSGRLAAYSMNKLQMNYHIARQEARETIETQALIAYYNLDTKTVKTPEELSVKERLETWPAWSADGKYLYFCNAPILWPETKGVEFIKVPEYYEEVKYNLSRISYDIEQDKWGQLETIVSEEKTDMSVSMPRTSPNGRWLSFCMTDFGYFPCWNPTSDIYLMDLKSGQKTGQYNFHKLQLSSDKSEGWQSWSSNSRWIAFSSKKDYGVFTRTYFSYIDDDGKASKPFVMPQKDPEYYDSCLETFTVPELITGPVKTTPFQLGSTVRAPATIKVDIPITLATPKAGGTTEYEPWRERE